MTYFILPQIEYYVQPNNLKLSINLKNTYNKTKFINTSLKFYLDKIKLLIEQNLHNWSIIKKYTNNIKTVSSKIFN